MNDFSKQWMRALIKKLLEAFGQRLTFAGLQGSRARGEERPDSDIDAVVILDILEPDDLQTYRGIVRSMPDSHLACGFVSGKGELAAWPRWELWGFYHDTIPLYGSMDFVLPFITGEEIIRAVQAGAGAMYHGLCHGLVFGGLPEALPGICKTAFFVLSAREYLRTGVYRRTKAELCAALDTDDQAVLELSMGDLPASEKECEQAGRFLFDWSRRVLQEAGATLEEDCQRQP